MVRRLGIDDVHALSRLLEQLGYPADDTSVLVRVQRLLADDMTACWVAETAGEVVGLLTAQLAWTVESDSPVARLTALVVDEDHRGQGVARHLTSKFEDWARQQGAVHATLNSGNHRDDAHAAYTHLGWQPTGIRFVKNL